MDLIGKAPELSEYPGNVKDFLFDLNMFFDSNALDDSRRRSLFSNVVGKVDRDKIRNECDLGKDPLDQLYDCLERVYSTHSAREHAASSGEKREAAFFPESGTAAGDAGFLAGNTPVLGATARSSGDSGSSGSPSRSPPAKRRNIRQVVNNIEDNITTATTATVSGRVGRDSQNIKVIADIVNSVLAHGEAEPFAQPVNLDDVPDYKDLVKDLMDFGTIRTRLKDMHYDDVETVLKDVHLVFHNCDAYNHESKDTYKSGLELERYFLKLLKTQLKDFFSCYNIALV